MKITDKKLGGDVLVLSLDGRLDPTTVRGLEERLARVVEGGASRVILDLARLDYISSAGLRVLLSCAKQLKGKQGALVLCAPKRYVKEVFDIAGFSAILPICDSEGEALAEIG